MFFEIKNHEITRLLKNSIETLAGQYFDQETGVHYNYYRSYSPNIGRYLRADPIGQFGGANLYDYVDGNPILRIDFYGLTWGETLSMLSDWIRGTGPTNRSFGPESNQVKDMMDAPGVERARQAFYQKNAGIINTKDDPCKKEKRALDPLTNYNPGFGLKGLWQAGLHPTEQFVGNYRVDIVPNSNGTITIKLTNTTSMTSLLYGKGSSWERSAFGPGGNMRQTYTWTEPLR